LTNQQKIIGSYEIKINTDNSQNENYKPVKADLFIKFYEDLNKDKEPKLRIGKE
jgi:hypothetical protein